MSENKTLAFAIVLDKENRQYSDTPKTISNPHVIRGFTYGVWAFGDASLSISKCPRFNIHENEKALIGVPIRCYRNCSECPDQYS